MSNFVGTKIGPLKFNFSTLLINMCSSLSKLSSELLSSKFDMDCLLFSKGLKATF